MFSRAFRFLKERTARVGRFTREGGLTADQSLADAHGPIRCGSEAVARGILGVAGIAAPTKKDDPLTGVAFALLPLPLIPTVCTQSHSHLAWCPAIRDLPQRRVRIACRLCRCRSSVWFARRLAGGLPTVACRFSRRRRAGTGRGCRSGRPRHWQW